MNKFCEVKGTQRAEEVKLVNIHCVLGLVGFWVVKEKEQRGKRWF